MPKKLLLLILSLSTYISFGQTERVTIQGTISSDSSFVENVHIINKNSRIATISNKYGKFQIPVKEGDTLLFSAIQYQSKSLRINKFLLANVPLLTINLIPKVNQLKEVIVKDQENMAKVLGLPNADKKPLTKLESRLNYHTKASLTIAILAALLNKRGGINDMYYIISGERKKDRKLTKLIEEDKYNLYTQKEIQNIRMHFKDEFFNEMLKIPTEEINFFIKYCLENDIINLFYKEMYIEIIDIFITESKPYLKINRK